MKVLWICNLILPAIARELGLEATNKEGWVSGLAESMLREQEHNQVRLAVASPVPEKVLPPGEDVTSREISVAGGNLLFYGFREDTDNPQRYDEGLEKRLAHVLEEFQPQVIHCFGTEFPHTLAACRVAPEKDRVLITLQGLCTLIADAYKADLPGNVIQRVTFRDFLRRDSLRMQIEKFRLRGESERAAVALAGNVGGRTAWDHKYAREWNPQAQYFELKETMRGEFYEGQWTREACESHSIFLSQGDYPIKGLHYVLLAMPEILKHYPDARLYVAGNGITASKTWKEKLKLSSYGKYLRDLIKSLDLEDKITFLGKLTASQMKEQYLKSHLFVCPSAIENSPNSLAEAMLLGMPCVAADVGGIPSMFTGGVDGVAYEGSRMEKSSAPEEERGRIVKNLTAAVFEIWSDPEREKEFCQNARKTARRNHDQRENYEKTMEAYAKIAHEGVTENGRIE